MNFNEKAKMWDQEPKRLERTSRIAEGIIELIKYKNSFKAMEFGAGTGSLSFMLKDYCSSITLIDTSEGMIEVLEEKIKTNNVINFHPLLLDLENNELDEKFDLIYTAMTLHHINDIPKIIEKLCSMLNHGGLICFSDLKPEDGSFHPAGMEGIHHKGIDIAKYKSIFENYGIKELSNQTVYIDKKQIDGKDKEFEIFLYVAEKK